MSEFLANLQKNVNNSLLDTVLEKLNSGTSIVPTVIYNRVQIDKGGYIADSFKVYFYIEATALTTLTKNPVSIGQFSLFGDMPAQYDSPRGWNGVFMVNGYHMSMTVTQASSTISNLGFMPTPMDIDININDKIVMYGFYLKK